MIRNTDTFICIWTLKFEGVTFKAWIHLEKYDWWKEFIVSASIRGPRRRLYVHYLRRLRSAHVSIYEQFGQEIETSFIRKWRQIPNSTILSWLDFNILNKIHGKESFLFWFEDTIFMRSPQSHRMLGRLVECIWIVLYKMY